MQKIPVICQVVGDSLCLGFIWYVSNAPSIRQTLINRLYSNQCHIILVMNTFLVNWMVAILVRFLPWPEGVPL